VKPGVRIARTALDMIVGHARETRPAECCGVLVGVGDEVRAAVRTRNTATEPHRFAIDPQDHIGARREARQHGLAVLGFYHSHPYSRAVPSETDRHEVAYTDEIHVIVGLATEPAEVRAFRFQDDEFIEVELIACDDRL
jgi:desampylase